VRDLPGISPGEFLEWLGRPEIAPVEPVEPNAVQGWIPPVPFFYRQRWSGGKFCFRCQSNVSPHENGYSFGESRVCPAMFQTNL